MHRLLKVYGGEVLWVTIIPIFLIPAIYFESTSGMIHVWMVNETFTHGFLVFPITLWLIWRKRSYLSSLRAVPSPRVATLLIPLILCWVVAAAVDVQIVQQFSMVAIILICVWLIVGWSVLRVVLFPLLFLFFSVPFGQSLIPPLMNLTANLTVKLVQFSGIPVYQDGLFFTLPTGSWSVIDECSGVRYLIASFTLGSIYAYLNYSSLNKRIVFITLSLIVPILGNILRAYGIVMIGHFSGMKLATGVDHLVYGWVFFGVIIFVMFYIGSYWRDPDDSFHYDQSTESAESTGYISIYPLLVLLSAIMLVLLSKVFVDHLKNDIALTKGTVNLVLPENFSEWQHHEDRGLNWHPIFQNPDVKVSRGYVFADELVQIDIAYYQTQRQGAEAISTSNSVVSHVGGDWKKLRSGVVQEEGKYFSEIQIRNGNTDILIWQWYRIGDFETPDPYIAKFLDAYNLILKGRTDAAMITFSTIINKDMAHSHGTIRDFWLSSKGQLDQAFENAIKINEGDGK